MKKLITVFIMVVTSMLTVNVMATQKISCADFSNTQWVNSNNPSLGNIYLTFNFDDSNYNDIQYYNGSFEYGGGDVGVSCKEQPDNTVAIDFTIYAKWGDPRTTIKLKSIGLSTLLNVLPGSKVVGNDSSNPAPTVTGTFVKSK